LTHGKYKILACPIPEMLCMVYFANQHGRQFLDEYTGPNFVVDKLLIVLTIIFCPLDFPSGGARSYIISLPKDTDM